jgi:hypothetical protein
VRASAPKKGKCATCCVGRSATANCQQAQGGTQAKHPAPGAPEVGGGGGERGLNGVATEGREGREESENAAPKGPRSACAILQWPGLFAQAVVPLPVPPSPTNSGVLSI